MLARLDAIDWKILSELQNDGRITNVNVRPGGSASPRLPACGGSGRWRKPAIFAAIGRCSTRNAWATKSPCSPSFTCRARPSPILAAFEAFVRSRPLVRECWMLSGEVDFILKCVAPDLEDVPGLRQRIDRRAACAQRQDLVVAADVEGLTGGADRGRAGVREWMRSPACPFRYDRLRSASTPRHRHRRMRDKEIRSNRARPVRRH